MATADTTHDGLNANAVEGACTGFLISRQWFDGRIPGLSANANSRALQLHFWFITEQGPVQAIINDQKPVCFAAQSSRSELEALLQRELGFAVGSASLAPSWEIKPLSLRDFDQQPVLAIYFREQRGLYRFREAAKRQSLNLLEADIQPTDRFLMERFITGAVNIRGEFQTCDGFVRVENPQITPGEYVPQYKVMSLDIETSMEGEHLYCIGATVAHTAGKENTDEKVFMLGKPQQDAPSYIEWCESEADVLQRFLDWYAATDADILIGWNVINFDLRFLQRKADSLRIPLTFGRDARRIEWRQSRDDDDHYTLTIPGRLVLDGIDTLKSATYNFESFALDAVGNELLNRGKLLHNIEEVGVENRGEEITTLFEQDQPALAAYNLEDCQLVWDIFLQTKLFDFAIERARLTGLAMDRFGGSVAAFDNRYLPRLHRAGFVAPRLKQNPEGVGSPGGYVMDSLPGLYQHVLVLDFKSLYPSIIRTFSIDPLARVQGITKELAQGITREKLRDEQESDAVDREYFVPGFNGAVFCKADALLPNIIDELWAARDQAKRDNNAAMSQAIKIIMNSFYGVLGTPGCRFFDYRLPSSITLRGHQILTRSKTLIEERGFLVIYGDTDSVFVWLKDLPQDITNAEVNDIGKALAKELNQWWDEHLLDEYHIDSGLEIEFETHYRQFVMPTIRGADTGSKKRYSGVSVPPNERSDSEGGELVFKGLEAVRTDWTPMARRFQRELYRRIFAGEDYRNYIKEVVAAVRGGEHDQQLYYRKRLRRPLAEYQRNVPPHAQAARKAEEWRQQRGEQSRYRRGSWVQYVLTTVGPEPLEYVTAPLDHELYIERQVAPIVDGIVQFMGTSFAEITDQQLGLF